jgi:hypothetical protein
VKSCVDCQAFEIPKREMAPTHHVVGDSLFSQFSIDFIGPFHKTKNGNRFIVLAVENFSRWPVAIATPDNDSITVAKFLYEHIFTHFGPPSHLLSDNGVHFLNNVVNQFLDMVNTNHKTTSVYHPQTNGMVEKINGIIVKSLKKMTKRNKHSWDSMLPAALYAYRVKIHSMLKISPFEAIYGQVPGAVYDDVLFKVGKIMGYERLIKLWDLRTTMEKDADILKYKEREHSTFEKLKIGDSVLLLDHKRSGKDKLDPVYFDTVYRIVQAYKNSFKIMDEQGQIHKYRVNAMSLKKFRKRLDGVALYISHG